MPPATAIRSRPREPCSRPSRSRCKASRQPRCCQIEPAEAISIANDTRYGLAAYIWTTNLSEAHRFAAEVKAGSVLVAGDDLGDLAAFDAADSLGIPAVKVCSGSDEVTELAARADVVVDGPRGVVALLRELADAVAP